MVEVPTPTLTQFGFFLAGFMLGLPAPYWYAQEQIRGFVRAILQKMPYRPPPGKDTEEALQEAVNTTDEEEA